MAKDKRESGPHCRRCVRYSVCAHAAGMLEIVENLANRDSEIGLSEEIAAALFAPLAKVCRWYKEGEPPCREPQKPLARLRELRARVDAGKMLGNRENDELRLLEAAVSSAAPGVLGEASHEA